MRIVFRSKIIAVMVLVILITLSFWGGTVYAQQNIRLIIDGKDVSPDVPPFIKNGRTFVPIRFVAQAFGKKVEWDEKKQIVSIGDNYKGVDLLDELPWNSADGYGKEEPVIIGGIKYTKVFNYGFNGEMNWNLNGQFNILRFSLGCPDDNGKYSNTLKVYGDGEKLFESGHIYPSDGVKDYELDISGIKVLTIEGFDIPLINPMVYSN